MPRPIRAHIDLDALYHNFSLIRQQTVPGAKIWAVVKANAYGHGLSTIVETLTEADGFALLEIDKAIGLRQAGLTKPILLLEGCFDKADYKAAFQYELTPVISQPWQLELFEKTLEHCSIDVYLKFNTGMNRLGFNEETIQTAIEKVQQLGCPITLMTHFANADNERGISQAREAIERLLAAFPELPLCAANSAAIFDYPDMHGYAVRPGIALYGSSPFQERSATQLGLKPVMTLMADIIAVQSILPGDTIGYGSTFTADKPMRVGIVACGYGDGYPRILSTGTPVFVAGKRSQLVGRVSMDMLCVDLTDLPEADIGSTVTLWGYGIAADEIAAYAQTIAYELFCQVTPRVPYHYYRQGIRVA